jgi:transposase InsO family protein
MDSSLLVFDLLVAIQVYLILRYARWLLAFRDRLGRRIGRRWRKLRGSMRTLLRRWLWSEGLPIEGFRQRRRGVPHNRTPAHIEDEVIKLHVANPHLGSRLLSFLSSRVLAFTAHPETFRRILARRRATVVAIEQERRKRRRRIRINRALELWGVDLTLVMLLGFFPVWLLGVIDYRGSKLMLLERCQPNTAAVCSALQRAFAEHGAPRRILSDNGPQFTSFDFQAFLALNGVDHTRIRPAHPWTNGRIERLFRTFKETVFRHLWVFTSLRQIDRYCADFKQFYNRDRPHSAYGGRTPDEVYFERRAPSRPLGRVDYFDGKLHWYRFG